MSLRNQFVLLAVSVALITLVGCGSSSNQAVPPPTGSFSNSNFNGTYVFSFSGSDFTNGNNGFFAVAGTLTANGSGGFTGGTVDIDDPALGVALQTGYVFTGLSTSGNYNVTADGRGSGTIGVTINGTAVQFGLDFVLTSNDHGLITRFDSNGTGSGTIDLQTANIAQSSLQGSYAFGLSGVDSSVTNSLSTVGSFTLDANGNVTTGFEDFNDNGNSSNLEALSVQGTVLAGSPGSAQLTTSAAGFGTMHFDVWGIDSTHLKFIETDSIAYLEGDAFVSTGQTSFPSGPLVFTLAGEDTALGSFAAGGLLTSDGTSLITGGLEDVNDEGDVAEAPSINGSFSSSGGRTVLTLNGIYNGYLVNNAIGTGNYTFAAYPYSGGIMLLEIDNGAGSTLGISGGNAYAQSATSLDSSQGYGLNLSGANPDGEADLIAEFTTNGGNMSGLYDVNNAGFLISDLGLGTGTYSSSSNGRGTVQFPGLQTNGNSMISTLNFTFYVVDSSNVVFVETDAGQLATGVFQLQNASGDSSAARSHFVVMQSRPSAHKALEHRK